MVRALLSLLLAAVLFPAAAHADTALPDGFAETTAYSVPSGEYLTAVRFAPDGTVFAAGKGGVIWEWTPGSATPKVFADLRLQTFDGWDRGVTGLAIDPDYDRGRPYVYVAYTADRAPDSALIPAWSDACDVLPDVDIEGCPTVGRVSRLAADGSETVLLDGFCDQSLSHSMGTLAFGPDGDLYVSAGDGGSYSSVDYGQDANACGDPPSPAGTSLSPPDALGGALRAQSYRRPDGLPATLDGTVLRIDPDTGEAAAGNPGGPDDVRKRIVAYGFRNPFRFAFRPGTGELWVGDVGFATWEEIDRVPDVSKVRNYGWPCYEGDVPQDGYEAAGLDACTSLPQADTEAPWFVYKHGDALGAQCPAGSSSISGMAFYDAAAFPARYRGALFFADYSRSCIWAMLPGSDGLPDPSKVEVFASGAAMPVDLQVGPDGALYYVSVFDGTIRRIAPVGDAPVAKIGVTNTGSKYSFDASGSTGDGLSYAWDLDGDGTYETTGAKPTHTYTHDGYVNVGLKVTDAKGSSGVATTRLTIGTPPTVSIDPGGDGWAVGDTIHFSGSAKDSSGATLSGSSLLWSLDLRHCSALVPTSCHTHRMQDMAGASGSFTAPDHDYPSHLELTLTATDANGLQGSQTVDLYPRTVNVTVRSQPEGLNVVFGGEGQATPFTRAVIAKATTTMSAGTPQSFGGDSYGFGSWSDGGAATHAVTVGADTTYDATYIDTPDVTFAGTDAVAPEHTSTAIPGRGEVYALTAARTGPVLGLRLHLDPTSTATRMLLGVYADAGGEAGALLASAAVENPAPGWNEARLDAPLQLSAGTSYWFGLLDPLDSGGNLVWNDHAGTPASKERTSRDSDLTAFPANWFVGHAYDDGGPLSAEIVGPGPVPSPTPSPTPSATDTPVPVPTTDDTPPDYGPLVLLPAPVFPPAPKPKLALPARLFQSAGGIVELRFGCPKTSSACRFAAELLRGKRRVARTTAVVAPGKAKTLRLRLAKRDRKRQTVTLRVTWSGATFSRQAVISSPPRSRSTKAA